MTVTIVAYVKPAKAGFKVTLWWYVEAWEEWSDIIDQTTDAAGKTTFTGFAFPYYPVKARVTTPAQIVDGDSYKECISSDIIIDNYETISRILYPELVTAPEPYLEEVYRDIEIWWVPSLSVFRAVVAPGYTCLGETLIETRACIDTTLEFLNPPEDPYEGLFAQVIAAVETWVMALMPGWVLEWGQNIYNTVNNIVENITNVYNDLREYVTNVYNNVYETIENTYNTFREYVTNVYNYLTEEITNIYNTTNEYVTNIIGASVEWVEEMLANNREWVVNFFKLMDPMGFLKDPMGTVSAAFALWKLAADNVIVESFLEGFEEGLEE